MLIISKYKDYYDYLSGIYGVDPKIVLDRRDADMGDYYPDNCKVQLYICGQILQGYRKNGRFYWKEDLAEIGRYVERSRSNPYPHYEIEDSWSHITDVYPNMFEDQKNINLKKEVPIILNPNSHYETLYPKLSDLGINKVIPASEIYLMLSEWLAPKDAPLPERTDAERIESAGFDKKTSFRGK